MAWAAIAILGFVTLQRLFELRLSARNTRSLTGAGAVEHGRGHYPLIVAVHASWLLALWVLAPGRAIHLPLLALFAALQLARVWVIATLGPRWTTRIIVVPDAPLVRRGPYRLAPHPNYLIVVLEIAVLPLVFGLWWIALVFTLANAGVLAVRIGAENAAIGRGRRLRE